MKYETFKKKIATLLNESHPSLNIEHRNGAKLFSVLEKELLDNRKFSNTVT